MGHFQHLQFRQFCQSERGSERRNGLRTNYPNGRRTARDAVRREDSILTVKNKRELFITFMKKAVIIFSVAILMAGGMFFVWQDQNERANAAKLDAEILKGLTADEIGLILKSEANLNRDAIIEINKNAEKRQAFIKGMHEYLALAAQARREGFADDENFKINVEYKKNILLADLIHGKTQSGQQKTIRRAR